MKYKIITHCTDYEYDNIIQYDDEVNKLFDSEQDAYLEMCRCVIRELEGLPETEAGIYSIRFKNGHPCVYSYDDILTEYEIVEA